MVVQETAASAGKGKSQATSVGTRTLHAMTLAMSLAGSALLFAGPATAQLIGATNVPGAQRPVVLAAPNGVPVANIATPSAAGVSRNVFSQFDVGPNGAILANNRGNVQTQLGGWIQGNPFLANGPARIILNEVNSGNPSQLRGWIEVGGTRAEVIIANPAGTRISAGNVAATAGSVFGAGINADARMQGLAAATLAMQGQAVAQGAQALANGNVGFKVTASIGSNKSDSTSQQSSQEAVGSSCHSHPTLRPSTTRQ